MKGRDILLHHGINGYVERSRKSKEQYGCGYGIYIPRKADEAEQILRQNGIRILARTERDGPR